MQHLLKQKHNDQRAVFPAGRWSPQPLPAAIHSSIQQLAEIRKRRKVMN
jgi:hypothetical protein